MLSLALITLRQKFVNDTTKRLNYSRFTQIPDGRAMVKTTQKVIELVKVITTCAEKQTLWEICLHLKSEEENP